MTCCRTMFMCLLHVRFVLLVDCHANAGELNRMADAPARDVLRVETLFGIAR